MKLKSANLTPETTGGVDDSPIQVAEDVWRFRIVLGVKPRGNLGFIGSQYDFDSLTNGIRVDYDYNGEGVDYIADGEFLSIAPTLHIAGENEFLHGWDISDLDDGIFSGVVYASARLTSVRIDVEADSFIPVGGDPDVYTSEF